MLSSLTYNSIKFQIFLAAVFLLTAHTVSAQQTYLLKNASKAFDLKVEIAACEEEREDVCEGPGKVYLFKKNQTRPFQQIDMENIFLELGTDRKPTANLIELYGENNSGIVFEDFNFDGAPDLALRNGNHGAYGGPSYDIFLAAKPSGKFILNGALSSLASENLGLFKVDKRAKTIETFTKSGCCWHQTVRYRIVRNRPQKIYVFTEDAARADGKTVLLTTETLVKGHWRKSRKTVSLDKYYSDK